MKNDNKGRDIFFGVVALATLIVAIVGATLAYFSVTASSNEGAINATAAVVSIEYYEGSQVTAQADKLIPANFEVVQEVYKRHIYNGKEVDITKNDINETGNLCIDDNGFQVCSVYRFSIKSETPRSITARLNNEENGFTYLSYAVYDVTKGSKATNDEEIAAAWLTLDDDGNQDASLSRCTNTNTDENDQLIKTDDCYTEDPETGVKKYSESPMAMNSIFGKTLDAGKIKNKSVSLTGNVTQVYDLVLFIKNAEDVNQNIDQGKNYRGNIVVDVLEGGIAGSDTISGYIDPSKS